MIVDPDFFDHWKTLLLVEELDGDQSAPLYILRLWAHCQNRRQANFSLSARALKALCRFPGEPEKLMNALLEAGFIQCFEGKLDVLGWEEYNAKLIANWENGKKGGRPKKPKQNPNESQEEPTDNPNETHTKPIREDRSRVDKNNSLSHTREESKCDLLKDDGFSKVWQRWRKHRDEKLKPLSETESDAQLMELGRQSATAEDAVAMVEFSIARGAVNLITNGDHRQKPKSRNNRGKRPTLEELNIS